MVAIWPVDRCVHGCLFCFFLWAAGWQGEFTGTRVHVWHLGGLAPRPATRTTSNPRSWKLWQLWVRIMSCPSRLGIDTRLQSCENGIDAKREGLGKIIECQGIKKHLWIKIALCIVELHVIAITLCVSVTGSYSGSDSCNCNRICRVKSSKVKGSQVDQVNEFPPNPWSHTSNTSGKHWQVPAPWSHVQSLRTAKHRTGGVPRMKSGKLWKLVAELAPKPKPETKWDQVIASQSGSWSFGLVVWKRLHRWH